MGARIKEHVETVKHSNLVQSAGYESVSNDRLEIPFRKAVIPDGATEEQYPKHPDDATEEFQKLSYQAKTAQEISAALDSIKETDGTGGASGGDANNQGTDKLRSLTIKIPTIMIANNQDPNNGAKMSKINPSDQAYRYFKHAGVNESGNDLYTCIFCSYCWHP